MSAGRIDLARITVALAVVALVWGCSSRSASGETLSYSNQTTLTLTLVVNGDVVATMTAGKTGEVSSAQLPALPWNVEARTSTGRVVVSMTVKEGDVAQGSGWAQGDAVRADLSCGRLDIWSGPPLLGPAPGSGQPGDCEP